MILTVTLNPLLERRFHFNSVKLGEEYRTDKMTFKAGGKGINVSRQLNQLGIKNIALTFLGGNNGKIIRRILEKESINFTAISTKAETRAASLIMEHQENRITSFFEPNFAVVEKEIEEFKKKLEKMISNASIVIFAGSSPCSAADEIFPYGIKLANQLDKISILDTYGNHWKDSVKSEPTVIHNNVSELEKTLNIDLSSEDKKLKFLDELYKKKIKLAFLTNGEAETYAAKFDFHYKVKSPSIDVVDPTGSGDAFTAGVAHGLENALVFDDMISNASALGTENAKQWNTCEVSIDEMESLKDKIDITAVGKKMKMIDDSPNTIS